MSEESVTSTAIVAGIYQGDRAAESLLVEKYSRSVLYILEKRCGDWDLARDICQETFLVLLEKFREQQLQEPEKLAAYIHRTAVNILIAWKRKQAKRQTFADSDVIEECIDGAASPLNDLELMHVRNSVRQCIADLKNGRDKEILYQYYIRERDKAEICDNMEIDHRHFDKVISRARSRLRAIVPLPEDDEVPEPGG